MANTEDFIFQFSGEQKAIMLYIHKWLTEGLNLTDKMRFKIPFYYRKSWICYMNPTKQGTIEFAFIRGNELSNSQGLLESKGRKQVYSIELRKLSEIPLESINEIIQESILLDQFVKYQSKRKSKNK